MPEGDVNLGKDTGEEKETKGDSPEYAPGVLCAAETSKLSPPLDFNEEEVNAIKALNRKIGMRDMPARREQIIHVWEERLFDRSYQHLLPRNNGGWELPAIGSGYGPGEEEDRSQWEIDIYSSYRKIICAALTREVPVSRFEPTDPVNDVDITSADRAEKLKTKIVRDNNMKARQEEESRFLWTDGLAVTFTRYELDAQAFGYEPEPEGDVPEDEETGEAATAIKRGEEGEPDEEETPDEEAKESEEPDEEPEEQPDRAPRGSVVMTTGGALEWKLPIKANSRKECPWARLSYELDIATSKASYPKIADKIRPSRSGSDGGSGGDDLERLARVNVLLGVEDNFITEDSAIYDVTIQKFFYRPAALMEIPDQAVRDSLLKKCWRGLYATMAGDVFAEGRNASMDDHLTITFADAGDGVNRLSLGRPLVAPQKILNTCAELAYEYFIHGVPMTYMDDEVFDIEAINDQENLVGGIRPFEATGTQIDGVYWFREEPVPFPDKLTEFTLWIMNDVGQLMSGAYPALFGGDMTNQGVGDALMQRDQALGRLGLPWRNIKQSSADKMRQAVQLIAQNGEGKIRLGGVEQNVVDVEDLRGNILCFPDTDENIPESWTQKSNRFDKIIEAAATNPFFQKLLDSPTNLKLVKQMSGFKELSIPMLESYEQQLGEIAILMKTGPAPNPDYTELETKIAAAAMQVKQLTAQTAQVARAAQQSGMVVQPPPELAALTAQLTQMQSQLQSIPPEISTYPIDVECDDHDVHAATTLEIAINSARGRAMKNGAKEQQDAFRNCRLHFLEHTAAAAKKKADAAAAAASSAPPKPPSLSANVKDLPPKEAAQLLQKAGIQSNPADFAAADEAEAVAKHPGQLAPQ
jgi:hypothetical protein